LKYGTNKAFVVEFDIVWKEVGFSRKDPAKTLLEKHFEEYNDYVKAVPLSDGAAFPINGKNLGGAGKNKETIMLTVDCFKNFCILASTSKAKIIRSYYVKMENIMHEYFQSKTLQLTTSLNEAAKIQHQNFLTICNNEQVVYMMLLEKLSNGKMLVKIGSSKNPKQRIDGVKYLYTGEDVIYLNIFKSDNIKNFELACHDDLYIKSKNVNYTKKDGTQATEVYEIDEEEHKKIVEIMNNIKPLFDTKITIEQQIKLKELDLELMRLKIELIKLKNGCNEDVEQPQEQKEKEKEKEKEDEDEELNKRIKNVPDKVIVMVNYLKTKIECLFSNPTEAIKYFNSVNSGHICTALKKNLVCRGKWWYYYKDVSFEFKKNYLKNNKFNYSIIQKYNSCNIEKIEPVTNTVLIKYLSLTEVENHENVNRKTLRRYIDNGKILNGYIWKESL